MTYRREKVTETLFLGSTHVRIGVDLGGIKIEGIALGEGGDEQAFVAA